MDIEKLIERLRSYTYWLGQDGPESHDIHPLICDEAADAISTIPTLQAENERLREAAKPNCIGCDWIHPDNGNCTIVGGFCTAVPAAHCPLIPKLRAELEQVMRALAMMWFAYINSDKDFPHSYETEALAETERLLGPWAECMPKYLKRNQKEG